MEFLRSNLSSIPKEPGVYLFLDTEGKVLYVGKAGDLRKRVSSYFQKQTLDEKTSNLISKIEKIRVISSTSEIEAFLLESSLIKKHNPKYNIRLTDGKSYMQVKITLKEKMPKVLLTRRENDKKANYFGPYPSSTSLKIVLKIIRKIFPYQSVANHQKGICLYSHLVLCPCPVTLDTNEKILEYRKNIRRIIKFLEGKTSQLISDLEKERNNESKNENFEEALNLQKKIDAIKYVTSPVYKPFQFEQNPNFKSEIYIKQLESLKEYLTIVGVNIEKIERMECFDISNTSGTNATGSMVVFTKGEKDSSNYRRFRIKNIPKVIPNDFAMIYEVISRRLKNTQWPYPDLLIVDGGKGQISSASKALAQAGVSIPVIGLAKREEIIITSDFKSLRLPYNSEGLKLVKRIRDEAHRFAITYHKKLRSKAIYA